MEEYEENKDWNWAAWRRRGRMMAIKTGKSGPNPAEDITNTGFIQGSVVTGWNSDYTDKGERVHNKSGTC